MPHHRSVSRCKHAVGPGKASAWAHLCHCWCYTSLTWRCHPAPRTGCWRCLLQVCLLAVPSGCEPFWHIPPGVWSERRGKKKKMQLAQPTAVQIWIHVCFQKVQSKDTEVFEGSLEFEEKNKFTTDLSPDGPHIRACVYSLHLARECLCYDLRQFGMTTKSLQGQIILFIGIF